MALALTLDVSYPIFLSSDVTDLIELALSELPENIEEEPPAIAWIAKRLLELGQQGRHRQRTIQVALVSWITNGERGRVFEAHPDGYTDLRSFLKAVGTREQGNQLSPSTITEMINVADFFVPYCCTQGIVFQEYIATDLWTKSREAIPALKAAILADNHSLVTTILADVKSLPSRDAVREKYRVARGAEKFAITDAISNNGVSVIVSVIPTNRLTDMRRILGRYTEWNAIIGGTTTNITVNIGGADVQQV